MLFDYVRNYILYSVNIITRQNLHNRLDVLAIWMYEIVWLFASCFNFYKVMRNYCFQSVFINDEMNIGSVKRVLVFTKHDSK